MKTSIATVSISGTLAEKLEAIAGAGFDGIEIFEQDFVASDLSPRQVGAMVRDHGLKIDLFQPFRDFEALPEPYRARAFARAARKFDLMNELGTDLILVCSSVHPAALGGIDRMAGDFAELGDLAAAHGVRVGFEALAWGRYINDHRDAWEVVRRADHDRVGLVLDSFHTLGRGLSPESIRAIPGDRIFYVQLADAPAIPMDLLYWSRHFRNMPGEGDLDVAGFMRAVTATGYSGPLSLEIFNDQFRAGLPRLIAQDGYRSLIDLMDRVRRAEPALPTALPAFAPPAPVDGVAFVEFATAQAEAPALEGFLRAAGFRPTAQHRSKSVTRWQQGTVNLLVNTETQGFAQTSYLTHGTTVSEIALSVPDARATQARAAALGIPAHADAIAAQELQIPAIRGVGGSVLRLLDNSPDLSRIWQVDFAEALDLTAPSDPASGPDGAAARPVAQTIAPATGTVATGTVATGTVATGAVDPATDAMNTPFPPGAGLIHIDHIAQTMAHDEMLSWSLFYHALFDATRAPMVDVADPDGLVRSQAVQAGALRVTLNGAEARRTLAGRFIEDTFGSSVQHIAFSTDDIFATARALAAGGFPVLQIGENYYADVEARFGLDAELTARMRACNVLYDEDAGGQFFQLYSTTRPDGLFFEVVQRCGAYQGYGAPNAPFRIAAQKRALRPADMPRR
ncbi:bifunctional sugar phosphate isomerase/epimerase/4-hydroxyphenylpyruvate dioxygenase family protein [Roseicitreum antarcticum]|uniref:bifunctional sugar phosphate isomerase/epimerase/4-hydroxyphenylpyruvate dioxygenase family protein n=1 Tax=Roseicitreum antarcticum TaxID=564137 RepID=UPI001CC212F3|nr:sugar phosphate isomerase/epimerase and 4-hydroxyphenylpyruvate domain-containing protein [Roseicitreum antarcticum]